MYRVIMPIDLAVKCYLVLNIFELKRFKIGRYQHFNTDCETWYMRSVLRDNASSLLISLANFEFLNLTPNVDGCQTLSASEIKISNFDMFLRVMLISGCSYDRIFRLNRCCC